MKTALLSIPAFEASKNVLDLFNLPSILLFVVLFAGMLKFKKLHPVVFIAIAAVVGIIFKL